MTTIEFAGILLAGDENGTPSGSSGDPMRILRVPRAPGKGRPGPAAIPAAAEATKPSEPGRQRRRKAACKSPGRNMPECRDGPESLDAKGLFRRCGGAWSAHAAWRGGMGGRRRREAKQ